MLQMSFYNQLNGNFLHEIIWNPSEEENISIGLMDPVPVSSCSRILAFVLKGHYSIGTHMSGP